MCSLKPNLWLADFPNQLLHSRCLNIRPGCAGLTSLITTINNVKTKSSNSMRHFQARFTRITSSLHHLCQLATNRWEETAWLIFADEISSIVYIAHKLKPWTTSDWNIQFIPCLMIRQNFGNTNKYTILQSSYSFYCLHVSALSPYLGSLILVINQLNAQNLVL